jgi:hypothetical protein
LVPVRKTRDAAGAATRDPFSTRMRRELPLPSLGRGPG